MVPGQPAQPALCDNPCGIVSYIKSQRLFYPMAFLKSVIKNMSTEVVSSIGVSLIKSASKRLQRGALAQRVARSSAVTSLGARLEQWRNRQHRTHSGTQSDNYKSTTKVGYSEGNWPRAPRPTHPQPAHGDFEVSKGMSDMQFAMNSYQTQYRARLLAQRAQQAQQARAAYAERPHSHARDRAKKRAQNQRVSNSHASPLGPSPEYLAWLQTNRCNSSYGTVPTEEKLRHWGVI